MNKSLKLSQLITLFVAILLTNAGLAQSGVITGKVVDKETGEELIGANVVIVGTTNGTSTDIDGSYSITGLSAGTYDLQVSYISYENKTITGVVVKNNETSYQDITMGTDDVALGEVVVEARAIRNTESSLLLLQKKSTVVMDGISVQQFSKMGDNDAAAAVRRVTGVSVEGGKYVYVRGLGDRYSKITLNNAEIPGLDPNRNSVQMDMFPSALIDNISVVKTFSADLPGDFTGGFVNISTKDFPEKFNLSFSASLGYNTNSSLRNDFITYEGGKLDWLGIDDGTRARPADAMNIPNESSAIGNTATALQNAQQIDRATRAFNKTMEPVQGNSFLDQNYSFSIGNQLKLGKMPMGIVFGLSYQNTNEAYQDGRLGLYSLQGGSTLSTLQDLTDVYGENNVLVGAILNTSLKLNDNNRISLNLLRNQAGTSSAGIYTGTFPPQLDDDRVLQSRNLNYNQRAMNFAQLKGEHYFPNAAKLRIDWHTAYTYSTIDQPDMRLFANHYEVDTNQDTAFFVSAASYKLPSRFYRNLDENSTDTKANFEFAYKGVRGQESKFKTGFSALYKWRTFEETRLDYDFGSSPFGFFDGNISNYLADANIGLQDQGTGTYFATIIQDASEDRNSYLSNQLIGAAYVMTDLPISKKFKINAGVRAEYTNIYVESYDQTVPAGEINKIDILPGVNFIYEVAKDMNLRLSYSRTIARPNFRELAPFASYDYNGGQILVGNPELDRTLIDNIDLRYELYMKPGELFSVSAFFKNFTNPIERAFNPAGADEVSFRNVSNAVVAGAEVEYRQSLRFISPFLSGFQVGANASYIYSRVNIDAQELVEIRAGNPDAKDYRRMFAQSPYLVNAMLSYTNEQSGTEFNANFNVFGARLAVVSRGNTPNVFEQPRPTLNFMVSQKIGASGRFKITLRANNLINPPVKLTYDFAGGDYIYRSFTQGRAFSIGVSYTVK